MRPKTITVALSALDANGVAEAQAPASGGSFTLNGALVAGGVATMDIPRHVSISSSADESANTITITGTDRNGNVITEAIAAGSASAVGSKNFATITSASISISASGDIILGAADECESRWYPVDHSNDHEIGFGVRIDSGASLTFTVQHTYYNDFQRLNNVDKSVDETDDVVAFSHGTVASKTANTDGSYTEPVTAIRLKVTGHTSGSAYMDVVQGR